MQICVIGGAGYVGLITGLGFAELGHAVINVDVAQERVQKLQAGQPPIHEEGLVLLLESNLKAGHLRFSCNLSESVEPSEVVFIAVGTPARLLLSRGRAAMILGSAVSHARRGAVQRACPEWESSLGQGSRHRPQLERLVRNAG